jgi:lipopolysaccharide/colanic/teichoic acid biosynthesis glycosyltransferase
VIIRKWEDLPENMRNESVRKYYEQLQRKYPSLYLKRLFDIIAGIIGLLVLSPVLIIIAVFIKINSAGPALFRQVRVTQYGKRFYIFKFRTMVAIAEKIGTQVTTKNDRRITPIGRFLRKYRLDEFPQLINIITGDMSFVGTRPDVVKYVDHYTDEMMATLLLPAGVTSEASISYKNEEELLSDAENVDNVYIEKILPEKMKYNLRSIEEFTFLHDISIMARTLAVVFNSE